MGHSYLCVEVACYLATAVSSNETGCVGNVNLAHHYEIRTEDKVAINNNMTPAVVNANNYVGVAIADLVISMVIMHLTTSRQH